MTKPITKPDPYTDIAPHVASRIRFMCATLGVSLPPPAIENATERDAARSRIAHARDAIKLTRKTILLERLAPHGITAINWQSLRPWLGSRTRGRDPAILFNDAVRTFGVTFFTNGSNIDEIETLASYPAEELFNDLMEAINETLAQAATRHAPPRPARAHRTRKPSAS